jgi:hypothetical protein
MLKLWQGEIALTCYPLCILFWCMTVFIYDNMDAHSINQWPLYLCCSDARHVSALIATAHGQTLLPSHDNRLITLTMGRHNLNPTFPSVRLTISRPRQLSLWLNATMRWTSAWVCRKAAGRDTPASERWPQTAIQMALLTLTTCNVVRI